MTNKIRGDVIDLPLVGNSPPTTGSYTAGQFIFNNSGNYPAGWRCTASGSPGDWSPVGTKELTASVNHDFPAVSSKSFATTTVSVPGAVLGDFCLVSLATDLANCQLTAYVSAVDTVTVVVSNPTSGSVNITSAELTVRVLKK